MKHKIVSVCILLFFVHPVLAQPMTDPSKVNIRGLVFLVVIIGLIYLAATGISALFSWLKPKIKEWVQSWKD